MSKAAEELREIVTHGTGPTWKVADRLLAENIIRKCAAVCEEYAQAQDTTPNGTMRGIAAANLADRILSALEPAKGEGDD